MKKKLKKIRYIFEFIAVIAFYFTVRALPLKSIALIGKLFGSILFLIPNFRKLICANLQLAFPEKKDCEIRRIGKKSLQNMIRTALELFWFSERQEILNKMTFDSQLGVDITKKYIENGGLIWISPHIGNWELAAFNVSFSTKIPFAVVVRPQNNPWLNKLIIKSRSSGGNRVIFEKGAVKGMIKALKDGYFLATLIDQNTRVRDGGIFVNFFGLPVPTSRSIAFFARKMNVNLAVGGCLRENNGYKIFAVELPKEIKAYKSDEEIVQDIMTITENIIRKYPEQYLWLYKRWQYIPNDSPPEIASKFPYYAQKTSPKFYKKK